MKSRRWLGRVDWSKLDSLFQVVFTKQKAVRVGSLLRCQVLPAMTSMRVALCDCSTLTDRPAEDACWDSSAPLVLGVRSVAKGTAGFAVTSNAVLSWFVSSCTDATISCVMEFGVLLRPTPSIDKLREGNITSEEVLSRVEVSASDVLYEPVYDSEAAEVLGISMSELIYLGMSPQLNGGIEICILPDYASQNNCTNCVPAFGFASAGTEILKLSSARITVRDDRFCGTVQEAGYYVVTQVNAENVGKVLTSSSVVLVIAMLLLLLLTS
jgi:hypothetical protein